MAKPKTAVITGGTGGIGFETARALAQQGWRVIVTGRNPATAEAAARAFTEAGAREVFALTADLSKQREVVRLTAEIADLTDQIDALILNAGVLDGIPISTEDDLPNMIAINHVAPWIMTHGLKDHLKAANRARVVIVSSSAHRFAQFDGETLEPRARFVGLGSYGDSKLFNLLTFFGWSREFERDGILVLAADPGGTATSMTDAMEAHYLPLLMRLMWPVMKYMFGRADPTDSRRKAARSTVVAATDSSLEGQTRLFVGPKGKVVKPSKLAQSDDAQNRALALTKRLFPAGDLIQKTNLAKGN